MIHIFAHPPNARLAGQDHSSPASIEPMQPALQMSSKRKVQSKKGQRLRAKQRKRSLLMILPSPSLPCNAVIHASFFFCEPVPYHGGIPTHRFSPHSCIYGGGWLSQSLPLASLRPSFFCSSVRSSSACATAAGAVGASTAK
jgi:hypothetical protein